MSTGPQPATHTIATPANAVTLARIVLSPVVVLAIYLWAPSWWVLFFGFTVMMTDQLDGWLARRYGTTELGAFLDPLADKIIVLGAFAVLALNGWIWWLPVVLITARELAMSWWRARLAQRNISVPARELAKWKVYVQSVTIAVAVMPGVGDNAAWVVDTMVWVSVVITLVTFGQYLYDGRRHTLGQAK